MNTISKNDLQGLATMNGEYVVSIYLPANVGSERVQNAVRFKTLVRIAGQKMAARKIGDPAIQKMTASARSLLDQPEFWQELSHGLTVFVSRDSLRAWPLPFACAEDCHVGEHPYLLPLVAWETSDAPYFVLAVSQNVVRLLHGTRAGIEELAVPDLPSNLTAALHYDPRTGTLQMHSGTQRLEGKEGVVFHGQGGEVDVAKQELTSFFREIDRPLRDYLQLHGEPLIFAGVDYLFPIYQAVNHYPHLLPTSIAGNPDFLSHAEIRARACPIMEVEIDARREAEIGKYWDSIHQGRTSNRTDEILPAAQAGVIDTLFLAPGTRLDGRFSPEEGKMRCDNPPRPDSEDLVNLAAVLVLRTGGSVEVMPSGNIPGGGLMAAILRYPCAAETVPFAKPSGAKSASA